MGDSLVKRIHVAPNNATHDLPLWVAQREGLFAAEGMEVEFIAEDRSASRPVQGEKLTPVASVVMAGQKETLIETGQAQVFNACEWGSIIRTHSAQSGAKIIQRRPVVYAHTLLVRNDSPVQLPEDLAGRTIGITWPSGNYFMAYRMLEGYLSTDQIRVVDMGGRHKNFEGFLAGDVEATINFEPFTSTAERMGARAIVEGLDQGEEVGSADMDQEARIGWSRALSMAVERINADPFKYYPMIIEAELPGRITPQEVRWQRVRYVPPSPYSRESFEATYRWMHDHKMIEGDARYEDLVLTG